MKSSHKSESNQLIQKEFVEPQTHTFEEPFFFIDTNEKKFCDVLNSFTCQQNMELVRKKWKVEREKIISVSIFGNNHYNMLVLALQGHSQEGGSHERVGREASELEA
jgi:hypothetical protein